MPLTLRLPTIGDLRERVTLDTPTFAVNAHGAKVPTYGGSPVTLSAAVWAVSGREAMLAQQLTAVLTSIVWIHYRTGISVKARIAFGSRTLQVEQVDENPDGRRRFTRLLCSEVQT